MPGINYLMSKRQFSQHIGKGLAGFTRVAIKRSAAPHITYPRPQPVIRQRTISAEHPFECPLGTANRSFVSADRRGKTNTVESHISEWAIFHELSPNCQYANASVR